MDRETIDNLIAECCENITDEVCEELKNRERVGVETYGTPLLPFLGDGNDMHQHLFEELLDAAKYLKTEMHQRRIFLEIIEGIFKSLVEEESLEKRREAMGQFYYIKRRMGIG